MKILLAQKLPYLPAWHGATRVGRCLVEGLAQRGHDCRVIALTGTPVEELERIDTPRRTRRPGPREAEGHPAPDRIFSCNGVSVYAHGNGARLHEQLKHHLHRFDPTWVIISEDPTYMLLAAALEVDPRRTLFLCQSQATLPFGPQAFVSDRFKQQMLEEAAALLASSNYLKNYLHTWGRLDSFVAAVPVYGAPPYPQWDAFDHPYVTMINPSDIKGLPIFMELARRFAEVEFAAVPTWATNAADRAALRSLPNVHVLRPSESIDDILIKTRVLLVPSLWGEAFGLVAVEAMLRGIPVLASNVGGLVEAKLGVEFSLPVRPIERYQDDRDENGIFRPILPEQDIAPWQAALRTVLANRGEYERIASRSRSAALNYVAGLSVAPVEQFLATLGNRSATVPPHQSQSAPAKALDGLPAEKLQRLASYLKKP